MPTRKVSFLGLISFFLAGIALGGEAIPNWAAPAIWTPPRAHSGLTTMGDVTSPLPFIGADPCRIADTRTAPGPYGAPSLTGGVPRNFTLTGVCAIPGSAAAVSLNVTVTNTQGPGFILIYPAGGAQPTVSTLNYVGGQTIANAAVVPLAGGAVTVVAGVSGTDLILDTNGYYSSTPAASSNFFSVINSGLYAIWGQTTNSSALAAGVYGTVTTGPAQGVFGRSFSSTDGTAGVFGWASTSTGRSIGVAGETDSTTSFAVGVSGFATASTGLTTGVRGDTQSTTANAAGVVGVADATTGEVFGVTGHTRSTTTNAAGVLGVADATTGQVAGVFGLSVSTTGGSGVVGQLQTSAGTIVALGYLGTSFNTAGDATGPPWGVFAHGSLGADGAKHFVEPHPSDPTRVILYSSLEGREVGTYFRGTARVVNHQAIIEVPEDFRMVTDDEGLTVQVTPMGASSTMYVESKDLNQIVVKASRDVTFDYLVQGVRRSFKDFEPVAKGTEFVPHSADEKMPLYLTEEAKRRLIANGTYNPDGTVNMETAERLGWAKAWREREEQAKAAAAGNAATLPGGLAKRD